ncbi:MAG: manganese efflux pump MntP family protein [Spirochaetia bacterium]
MNLFEVVGIALALSMDALSVSVTEGFVAKKLHFRHAFRMAFFFGLFQALMPVIGFASGFYFREYIREIDHWIAFALLALVGGKMIFESFQCKEGEDQKGCSHFPTLLTLSVATSIDALAAGVSFVFLGVSIILPVLIIGLITFAVCLAGAYIGNKIGHFFESRLELTGGIILIGIGVKILVEHLLFM